MSLSEFCIMLSMEEYCQGDVIHRLTGFDIIEILWVGDRDYGRAKAVWARGGYR